MSTWYVGCESLSMITDIISRYLVGGYNSFGFNLQIELVDCFRNGNEFDSDDEIFEKLRQMNIDALKHEYPDTYTDRYDDDGYEQGHDIWKPRESEVQSWHYQLLKSLDCYVYQCSSGKVIDTDLYKAMDAFINAVAKYIAMNQPEYAEAFWQ